MILISYNSNRISFYECDKRFVRSWLRFTILPRRYRIKTKGLQDRRAKKIQIHPYSEISTHKTTQHFQVFLWARLLLIPPSSSSQPYLLLADALFRRRPFGWASSLQQPAACYSQRGLSLLCSALPLALLLCL